MCPSVSLHSSCDRSKAAHVICGCRQMSRKNKIMKSHHLCRSLLSTVAIMACLGSALAQQVTGTPGSPSATTTINGNQIPAPPPKFGGVIKETLEGSKTWWPPRVVPPKGAPNVLLIMTDDQGYGVSGTFGGVIPTPALDRIAKAGLRYTAVQLHRAVLADAGGADHRPQPSLGGLRRDHRAVDGFPGL